MRMGVRCGEKRVVKVADCLSTFVKCCARKQVSRWRVNTAAGVRRTWCFGQRASLQHECERKIMQGQQRVGFVNSWVGTSTSDAATVDALCCRYKEQLKAVRSMDAMKHDRHITFISSNPAKPTIQTL